MSEIKFSGLNVGLKATAVEKQRSVKVFGIGDGGLNYMRRLMEANLNNVEFIAASSDEQRLNHAEAGVKILIGEETLKGLGSQGQPAMGKEAAMVERKIITGALANAEMVVITTALGDDTGSGAAPVIAAIAHEMGVLVVAFVTTPFSSEGQKRAENALESIVKLKDYVDVLFEFKNDTLLSQSSQGIGMNEAIAMVDRYFSDAICCFLNLFQGNVVRVAVGDFPTLIDGYYDGSISIGHGSGDNMAVEAVNMALPDRVFKIDRSKSDNILINLTTGPAATINTVSEVCSLIQQNVNNTFFVQYSHTLCSDMNDQIKLTIVFLCPCSRNGG
ncbi:MAG: cell division protein FtsZ [Pusillimonas sp.]